jgi:replicative DNA helicase
VTVGPPNPVLPPQNIEAEESVLGAMLIAEGAIAAGIVDARLHAKDFYRDSHRTIFEVIKSLYHKNEAVDPLTVCAELEERNELDKAGGKGYVYQLASAVPAAGNARQYARIVKDNSTLRGLLEHALKTQINVTERRGDPQHLIEDAERRMFEVAHDESAKDFRSIDEVLHDEFEKLSRAGQFSGTPSGFRDLDQITGGFQASNLVVLAARPSMGKSALVTNMAEHVAVKENRPVALFSLEMSETELAQRFVASQARMPGDKLRKGQVAHGDWPKVVKACEALQTAPLWIDDSSDIDILELRAKARRLQSSALARGNGGLALIIVDYLQLMRPDRMSDSRVEQVGQISRGLKILARELEVPVLAVSQLSRAPEQRPGEQKRPLLSDLRESGQIEQDADLVMFIYRDEYYNPETENPGVAEIIVAKHRNGPTGKIELTFLDRYPKFASKAREERPPAEQLAGDPSGLL